MNMSLKEGNEITKLMEQIRKMKEEGADTKDLQKILDRSMKNPSINTLNNIHR